jgi:hypothetical protein
MSGEAGLPGGPTTTYPPRGPTGRARGVPRGAFREECWTPPLFGTLLGIPGVGGVREQRERLTVRIAPDALHPVAEVFGFRKPARAVDLPQEATRSRASR